jgi:hypothetical protein
VGISDFLKVFDVIYFFLSLSLVDYFNYPKSKLLLLSGDSLSPSSFYYRIGCLVKLFWNLLLTLSFELVACYVLNGLCIFWSFYFKLSLLEDGKDLL